MPVTEINELPRESLGSDSPGATPPAAEQSGAAPRIKEIHYRNRAQIHPDLAIQIFHHGSTYHGVISSISIFRDSIQELIKDLLLARQ